MPELEARDVAFAFGDRPVLRGITLAVGGGNVTGLVGPNGSGKTTLLRCLAGLLSADGRVAYGGTPIESLTLRERARRRAYVPQAVSAAFPYSAAEVAAMGTAHQSRFYGAPEAGDGVRKALEEVAFEPPLEQRFDRLSGGERQQVVVARALLQASPILLLDEPTSALDLKHRAAVVAALRRRAQGGAVVVLSLHDLNLAALACDTLLLLDHGRVAARGSPDEVLKRETIERVYGVPVVCDRHPTFDAPRVALDPSVLGR
ncbi:MAG: ABC transporter ATP-binding protein [Myxococcota bacterium]